MTIEEQIEFLKKGTVDLIREEAQKKMPTFIKCKHLP